MEVKDLKVGIWIEPKQGIDRDDLPCYVLDDQRDGYAFKYKVAFIADPTAQTTYRFVCLVERARGSKKDHWEKPDLPPIPLDPDAKYSPILCETYLEQWQAVESIKANEPITVMHTTTEDRGGFRWL